MEDEGMAELSTVVDEKWFVSKETESADSERWSVPTRIAFVSAATLMSWGIVIALGYGISRLV
jgi:hypothetical protein